MNVLRLLMSVVLTVPFTAGIMGLTQVASDVIRDTCVKYPGPLFAVLRLIGIVIVWCIAAFLFLMWTSGLLHEAAKVR